MALKQLARTVSGGLIVINSSSGVASRSSDHDAGRAEFDWVRLELGLTDEKVDQLYIPIPGLQTDHGEPGLGMVRFTKSANLIGMHLTADSVDSISVWPAELVPVSETSIFSIALRIGRDSVDFSAVHSALVEELEQIVEMQAALEQQSLYRELSGQVAESSDERLDITLLRVIATRNRYSQLLSLLYAYRPISPRIESAIRQTLADLDALIGSQSAFLLSRLHRAAALSGAKEAELASKAQAAETRLARVVSALVLPTLWLSFLGTNVLPTNLLGVAIPGEIATGFALGGTLLSGVAGWFAVGWVFRGIKVR
ncbi:hypothetical protein [Curtobacterium oceanosedimentum]|uniref:hypothetical protein n=1 Tax=Curtobacterium oceanosedimentum TaxID=465820 RepID=UPI001CE104E3|nr:hypothetical protein [Curtobacterium oceanosedimentum]MCA5922176.1 hypothetical protein [Curtobacterium oceanosedimentum]